MENLDLWFIQKYHINYLENNIKDISNESEAQSNCPMTHI